MVSGPTPVSCQDMHSTICLYVILFLPKREEAPHIMMRGLFLRLLTVFSALFRAPFLSANFEAKGASFPLPNYQFFLLLKKDSYARNWDRVLLSLISLSLFRDIAAVCHSRGSMRYNDTNKKAFCPRWILCFFHLCRFRSTDWNSLLIHVILIVWNIVGNEKNAKLAIESFANDSRATFLNDSFCLLLIRFVNQHMLY